MIWTATLAVLFLGCEAGQPNLTLESVEPTLITADRAYSLEVVGSFYAPVGADLSSGTQHLQDEFVVELGGIPLGEVFLFSEFELSAVVPLNFALGEHDLVVRDTLGRQAELARAVRVLPPDAAVPQVVITSHSQGERVLPGDFLMVVYSVFDSPPGRIKLITWNVSGATFDQGEQSFSTPLSEFHGALDVRVPLEPRDREIVIVIQADDDAPVPNHGSVRLELFINHCQMSSQCDDGQYCNGEEHCDDGLCVDGEPPDCDDGVDCTVDVCEELIQNCLHIADDALCFDGSYCNGEESCDEFYGCLPGPPPCIDHIMCTIDQCVEPEEGETIGECYWLPSNELCSDGVFCNGIEICDIGYGCIDGADPCMDAFECTTITCDEEPRHCDVVLDDAMCHDGDVCTIDRCVKEEGCVYTDNVEGPAGSPSCSDGIDNDCDEFTDDDDPGCHE